MDLLSADHTAEVRISTAVSLIKDFVQSLGWAMVPTNMLGLDDASLCKSIGAADEGEPGV